MSLLTPFLAPDRQASSLRPASGSYRLCSLPGNKLPQVSPSFLAHKELPALSGCCSNVTFLRRDTLNHLYKHCISTRNSLNSFLLCSSTAPRHISLQFPFIYRFRNPLVFSFSSPDLEPRWRTGFWTAYPLLAALEPTQVPNMQSGFMFCFVSLFPNGV